MFSRYYKFFQWLQIFGLLNFTPFSIFLKFKFTNSQQYPKLKGIIRTHFKNRKLTPAITHPFLFNSTPKYPIQPFKIQTAEERTLNILVVTTERPKNVPSPLCLPQFTGVFFLSHVHWRQKLIFDFGWLFPKLKKP
jgi:hypothetical protein